ncbi:MAG: hypothetical protein LLF83_01505 [Methanobacterium sp.]|nr:hypothetical protein [Methanobacterium sp.]
MIYYLDNVDVFVDGLSGKNFIFTDITDGKAQNLLTTFKDYTATPPDYAYTSFNRTDDI